MALTCKRALDQDLIGKIASATGVGRRDVGNRLRKATGQTLVRTVFAENWPQGASGLGHLPAGTVIALDLVPAVAEILGLPQTRVAKDLSSWHPNKWTQNIFADRWPEPDGEDEFPFGVVGQEDDVDQDEDEDEDQDEDQDERTGLLVNGRYEIRQVLGKGGFGRAERAWDRNREIQVVLKYSLNARVDQLQRELRSALGLRHDNICACYDIEVDQSTGEAFLVFEFGGESLAAGIEKQSVSGLPAAIAIAEQIAVALDYAHGKSIFHNDVSPSNILIAAKRGGGWHARLTDFGIASFARPTTKTLVADHPGYGHSIWGPPELLAAGEEITRRGDQYSLALVLCAILEEEVFEQRYRLRAFGRLSAGQNAALRRALSLRHQDRFPTCAAFLQALRSR